MLSIYDWFGYEVPIGDRYTLIKEAGFDGVLLWWGDGLGRGPDYRKSAEYASRAGLRIENIHTPFLAQNDLSLDSLDGSALFGCYLQCVRDCAGFGIPAMVVHLPDDSAPMTGLGMDRVKRIADEAERLGVRVAMENVNNLRNLSRVLGEVDSEKIGFCYDCCHHANHKNAGNLTAEYGSRLMALHLHDNGGAWGQHRLPFDGTINWAAVMKDIAKTGYQGPTALEPMNWGYEAISIREFLERAYEKAQKLEAMRV